MSDDQLPVCPDCGTANPAPKAGGNLLGNDRYHREHRYRCVAPDCDWTGDTVAHRERRGPASPRSPHARALLETDPEDLPSGRTARDTPDAP
jgi:hypothetical protein